MNFLRHKLPGIMLCTLIAGISTLLASLNAGSFSFEVIGAPVFAILIGMLITLFIPSLSEHSNLKNGIKFTSKKILQWAVIISTIAISLITAIFLMKLLKVDKKVSCLIGVGSSICGGSAIAAAAPVIGADDEDVAQSISVIFLFNVLAALIFPALGHSIGLGTEGFAVFAGTAVNDTSSVTAASSTAESIYNCDGILSAAVTVKLTRTLAIIPITLILAFIRTRNAKKSGSGGTDFSFKKIFPWFILYFIGASIITTIVGLMSNSPFTAFYNDSFITAAKWLAKFFISMAMCAIGLNTNIIKLVKNGGKPILMGFCCWTAITIVSIVVQKATGIYYTNI